MEDKKNNQRLVVPFAGSNGLIQQDNKINYQYTNNGSEDSLTKLTQP